MEIRSIKTLGNIEYVATDDGRILRKMKHKPRNNGSSRERVEIDGSFYNPVKGFRRGKESKLENHYLSVDLSGRGTTSIHRLICEAFYGNINEMVVNHINGVKNDNRLENIEVVTEKENINHAMRTGLRKSIDYNKLETAITTLFLSQREIAIECNCSTTIVEKYIRLKKLKRPIGYSGTERTLRNREKIIGSKWYRQG